MGRNIEADYLVVGAGAMGLAFADTLVSESDATVVVVDRNDQPGGHWIRAASTPATTNSPAAPKCAPISTR